MTVTETLHRVLGGVRGLAGVGASPEELRGVVRRGLPYSALEAVMANLELGREEISPLLHLPLRTFSRRKREHRLNPDESDRLVRLARVAAQAVEVLGDARRAAGWLKRPNRALGGDTPLDLLDTDLGARQVEAELGRIEHGVYS